MFHPFNPDVIEANDIEELRFSDVQTLPDGSVVARLAVKLNTERKTYSEHPGLHLTDGVTPRLLLPSPSETSKTTKEKKK